MNGPGRGSDMMPYQMRGMPQYGNQARPGMSQPMYGMHNNGQHQPYMYPQYGNMAPVQPYYQPYQQQHPMSYYPYQQQTQQQQQPPPPPPPQNPYSSNGNSSQYAPVPPVSAHIANVSQAIPTGQYNNEVLVTKISQNTAPANIGIESTKADNSSQPFDGQINSDNTPQSASPQLQQGDNSSNDSQKYRSLLTNNNRKEGWEKYLNDEDRLCVENILNEASVFDSQYTNFEKEFTKMHTATSMLGDNSLKVYNSMWTEWKNKLLTRREQTIQLQEQTLNRLYKKVCQNFPLFVTKDFDASFKSEPVAQIKSEPQTLKSSPTPAYQQPHPMQNQTRANVGSNVLLKGTQVSSKPFAQTPKQPSTAAIKAPTSPVSDSFAASEMGKVKAILNNDNLFDSWSRESLGDVEFQRANNDFSFLRNQMKFVNNLLLQNRNRVPKKLPNVINNSNNSGLFNLTNSQLEKNLIKNTFDDVVPNKQSNVHQNTNFITQQKDFLGKSSNQQNLTIEKQNQFAPKLPDNKEPLINSTPTTDVTETKPILAKTLSVAGNVPLFPYPPVNKAPLLTAASVPILKPIVQTISIASSSNSKYSGYDGPTPVALTGQPIPILPGQSMPILPGQPIPILPGQPMPILPGQPMPIPSVFPKTVNSGPTRVGPSNINTDKTHTQIKSNQEQAVPKETDKSASSSEEVPAKLSEEPKDSKQIPTLVKKRPPVPPKVIVGPEISIPEVAPEQLSPPRKNISIAFKKDTMRNLKNPQHQSFRDQHSPTDQSSSYGFKSTYYESKSNQYSKPTQQDIDSFLERERNNLKEKPSYTDTRFYTVPRKYTEEPLYIKELLEPPARSYRPPRIAFIIRGLPGSGKSHLARMIKEREERFSSSASTRLLSLDDYFVVEKERPYNDPNENLLEYDYDPVKEPEYKVNLFKAFRKTLLSNFYDFVILDSVNSSISEVREFYACAIESGFIPYVVEMEAIVRRILNDCINGEEIVAYCYKHNKHGRSLSEIRTLYENWELLPMEYLRADAFSMFPIENTDTSAKSDTFSTGDNRSQSQHSGNLEPSQLPAILSTYSDYDTEETERLNQISQSVPMGHSTRTYPPESSYKDDMPDSYVHAHDLRQRSPEPHDHYRHHTSDPKRARYGDELDQMDYSYRQREAPDSREMRSERDTYGYSSDYYERKPYY